MATTVESESSALIKNGTEISIQNSNFAKSGNVILSSVSSSNKNNIDIVVPSTSNIVFDK